MSKSHLTSPSSPPNAHPSNPLLWPSPLRHALLLPLLLNALLNGLQNSILIPAFPQLASDFTTTLQTASYLSSIPILFLGIGPLLWCPLATAIGRRPVFLLGTLTTFLASLGAAYAHSYAGLMVARVFQSLGISVGGVFGAAVIVDVFPPDQRGAKVNLWTVMVTVGPAVGGLIGGVVVEGLGWRWAMRIVAVLVAGDFVGYAVLFPETRWVEEFPVGLRGRFGVWFAWERVGEGKVFEPFLLLQSPVVLLVILAFGTAFGFISVGLSLTLPSIFEPVYGFAPKSVSLIFLAYLVGAFLGGQVGGQGSDYLMRRHQRMCEKEAKPIRYEHRLWAVLPGYFCGLAGIIIFGVTTQAKTHWSGPVIAFGLANFGLQIVMNVITTYCVDCYRSRAMAVNVILNLPRQIIGFSTTFWVPPLVAKADYGLGIGTLAIICAPFFALSLVVLARGHVLRERYGVRGLT